jgi:hypothetical protein
MSSRRKRTLTASRQTALKGAGYQGQSPWLVSLRPPVAEADYAAALEQNFDAAASKTQENYRLLARAEIK